MDGGGRQGVHLSPEEWTLHRLVGLRLVRDGPYDAVGTRYALVERPPVWGSPMQVVRWLSKDEYTELSMLMCPDTNSFMFGVYTVAKQLLLEASND